MTVSSMMELSLSSPLGLYYENKCLLNELHHNHLESGKWYVLKQCMLPKDNQNDLKTMGMSTIDP